MPVRPRRRLLDATAALALSALTLPLATGAPALATDHDDDHAHHGWSGPRLAEAGHGRCATSYDIEVLDGLGGDVTYASVINERGEVAGKSRTSTTFRPLLPFRGDQQLAVPEGSTFGRVMGLNARGQAVGEVFTAAPEQSRAARWDRQGRLEVLPSPGVTGGVAESVNSRGQVVGATTGHDGRGRATVWDAKGRPGVLPFLDDREGATARALDIDDDGTVVGTSTVFHGDDEGHAHGHRQGVLWTRRGEVHALGALSEHGSSVAKAVNGAYVVGEATVERSTAAVTFTEEGPRTLPALQGWAHSTAEDVNPGGVAVGSSVQFAGHPGFGGAATVWCEGRAVDLNAVTPDLPAGLTLVNAGGVNPRGQVVGYATGTDGRTLGVVLTPAG